MTYLHVSGITLRCDPLADVPVISALVVFPSPLLLSLEVKTGALPALVLANSHEPRQNYRPSTM
jgi:hypothetical protein